MGGGSLSSFGKFSDRPERRCRLRAHLTTVFLFLTSTRGRDYHFFVKGGSDSEPNMGKVVQHRKAKSYNQNFFVQGSTLLQLREVRPRAVAKSNILAMKILAIDKSIADAFRQKYGLDVLNRDCDDLLMVTGKGTPADFSLRMDELRARIRTIMERICRDPADYALLSRAVKGTR